MRSKNHRCSLLAVLTVAIGGCASAPPPAPSPEPVRDPHADTWTPQSPQEKWWEASTPCPAGAHLVGAPPPKGNTVECLDDAGKRQGPSSVWFGSGFAGTFAEYANGVPHGRWLYWLHANKLIEGQHVEGRRQGKWTYWFDDVAFDTESRMASDQWSKNYVVEEYNLGLLVSTQQFRDGALVK